MPAAIGDLGGLLASVPNPLTRPSHLCDRPHLPIFRTTSVLVSHPKHPPEHAQPRVPPFCWLQVAQRIWRFSTVVAPPIEKGMMWSYWMSKLDPHWTHWAVGYDRASLTTMDPVPGWMRLDRYVLLPSGPFRFRRLRSHGRHTSRAPLREPLCGWPTTTM